MVIIMVETGYTQAKVQPRHGSTPHGRGSRVVRRVGALGCTPHVALSGSRQRVVLPRAHTTAIALARGGFEALDSVSSAAWQRVLVCAVVAYGAEKRARVTATPP